MKIAVCMFYDDNIKEYSDITRSINDIYCRKHGIDLIVSKTARKSERKPHWERIYLILVHLSNYDYMVWIDSDAFFYEVRYREEREATRMGRTHYFHDRNSFALVASDAAATASHF